MSRGVNRWTGIGNLGKDPDCSYTQGGMAVVKFSIATSEEWKDKATGEKKEKTEWHRLVAFGKLAEICGEYLKKGAQVYVEGKLQTRSWDQDGVTRYMTEIVIDEMQMLGSKPQTQQAEYRNAAYTAQVQAPAQEPEPPKPYIPPFDDDDIPF